MSRMAGRRAGPSQRTCVQSIRQKPLRNTRTHKRRLTHRMQGAHCCRPRMQPHACPCMLLCNTTHCCRPPPCTQRACHAARGVHASSHPRPSPPRRRQRHRLWLLTSRSAQVAAAAPPRQHCHHRSCRRCPVQQQQPPARLWPNLRQPIAVRAVPAALRLTGS